jgi:hypothetical protein
MARLVLTVGGYVLGNLLLPGIGGAIGGAIGGYVGGIVDQQLFGSDTPDQTVYGARLQDLRVQSSSYGSVIPTLYGKGRLASNILWMRGFDEEVRTETQTVGGGGKGGGGGSRQTTNTVSYHYYCDLAVGLCAGPITSVPRVFADGNAFAPAHVGAMRVHAGSEAQTPDPLIEAVEGADRTPAYRGLAYVVLERLYITPYGNRLPQLTFEVTT